MKQNGTPTADFKSPYAFLSFIALSLFILLEMAVGNIFDYAVKDKYSLLFITAVVLLYCAFEVYIFISSVKEKRKLWCVTILVSSLLLLAGLYLLLTMNFGITAADEKLLFWFGLSAAVLNFTVIHIWLWRRISLKSDRPSSFCAYALLLPGFLCCIFAARITNLTTGIMAVSIALVFTGYALLVIRFFKKNVKSGGLSVYGTIGLFCSSALAAQYALTVYNQDNIGVSAATVFCLIFLPAVVLTLLRIVRTAFIKPMAKLSVKALIPRVLYTAVFCAIFTFFPRHSFYSNFEGRWHYIPSSAMTAFRCTFRSF